jgi:predicted Zn-dependent protease
MSERSERRDDLAERTLELVRSATGGAAEAEVVVDTSTLALTRFANSFIHQNVEDTTTSVRLRLHLDGRSASGATTRVASGDGLARLVERTVTAARVQPPDPGWGGLSPPAPAAGSGNADVATADASPAQRAEVVRAFVDAAGGLECAGYCQTTHTVAAFANSAGQHLVGDTTGAALDGIARTGSSDGSAHGMSVRLADLDGAALGARAGDKARTSTDAIELPPGEYEVVLEPFAAADIMLWMAVYGFNGRAVNEGRSFVRVGEVQFDESVTIVDDAIGPDAIGLPFDIEGTPKDRLVFVDDGVTRAVAHDRRTAKEAGEDVDSTGHAIPGGESWGAIPANVRLEPASGDVSVDDLVAEVERGILVTDFNYTRVLDPTPLVVTGLTRNGVWLIEGGKLATAVQNFRYTQSYPRSLAPGAVLGRTSTVSFVPTEVEGLGYAAPAVRLASWRFTGGASG